MVTYIDNKQQNKNKNSNNDRKDIIHPPLYCIQL